MSNIKVEFCPICNNDKFSKYLKVKDYSCSNETYQLEKCDKCKFVFTQNFPDSENIAKYYKFEDYISHSDSGKGIVNIIYHKARKIALKSKANLVERSSLVSENGRLLDIGAGTGYFVDAMNQRGWYCTGLEKSEDARNTAKRLFNIDLLNSDEINNLDQNSYDIITLWHVLEHIENLNETLKKIKSLLKINGVLVIAVPNISSYDAEYYKQYWAAYDVPRHLWHFEPKTLALLAAKHKLEVAEIKPMNFDGFYISMLSEKYEKSAIPFVSGILKGSLFFARNLFTRKNLRSSSLIYILKKNN